MNVTNQHLSDRKTWNERLDEWTADIANQLLVVVAVATVGTGALISLLR